MDPFTVVEGFIIAMNDHDMDAVADSLADDVTAHIEPPPPEPDRENYNSREEVLNWLAQLVKEDYHSTYRNFEMLEPNRVIWISDIVADRYEMLGIRPAEVINEAVIEADRIKALTVTFPPDVMDTLRGRAAVMSATRE